MLYDTGLTLITPAREAAAASRIIWMNTSKSEAARTTASIWSNIDAVKELSINLANKYCRKISDPPGLRRHQVRFQRPIILTAEASFWTLYFTRKAQDFNEDNNHEPTSFKIAWSSAPEESLSISHFCKARFNINTRGCYSAFLSSHLKLWIDPRFKLFV